MAFSLDQAIARYSDSAGKTRAVRLDRVGQAIDQQDGVGSRGEVIRNSDNQVIQEIDVHGFLTSFEYDSRGNLIERSAVMRV